MRHPILDELQQPFVGQVVAEATDVGVHSLPLNAHRQRIKRLMRAATGTEPVRKAFEVDLVYLIEDRHHGLLNNFVLQSSDAQRTLPPVALRYKNSSPSFCPIPSTLHPPLQIAKPTL